MIRNVLLSYLVLISQFLLFKSRNNTWIKQFGTSSDDYAYSVTTDSNNFVYVAGKTKGGLDGNTNAGGSDVFLGKFDSEGNKIWTKLFGTSKNDEVKSIATNSKNFVYVAGYTERDLNRYWNQVFNDPFMLKFDSEGNLKMQSNFTGDYVHSISVTIDSNDSAHVALNNYWNIRRNILVSQAFTFKFDREDKKIWSENFEISEEDDVWAHSITTDSNNFVYAVGFINGNRDKNYKVDKDRFDTFVIKFDSKGNKIWVKDFAGPYKNEAYSVTTDSNNFVYVAGIINRFDVIKRMFNYDAFLAKFNSTGNLLWLEQFGTSSDDYAYSVTTDSKNFVYVAGFTEGSLDGNTNAGGWDAFLTKFSPSGNRLWTKQFGTSSDDRAYSVTMDSNNFVYVAGTTKGSLDGNTNAGGQDSFLVKFDSEEIPCNQSCLGCTSNDLAKCFSCASGYFKKEELIFPTECFKSEPQGYFLLAGSVFSKCHQSCQNCSGPKAEDCLNNKISCISDCLVCKTTDTCDKCRDGFTYVKSSNKCDINNNNNNNNNINNIINSNNNNINKTNFVETTNSNDYNNNNINETNNNNNNTNIVYANSFYLRQNFMFSLFTFIYYLVTLHA